MLGPGPGGVPVPLEREVDGRPVDRRPVDDRPAAEPGGVPSPESALGFIGHWVLAAAVPAPSSYLGSENGSTLLDGPATGPNWSVASLDRTGEYPFDSCGGRASDPARPLSTAATAPTPPVAKPAAPIRASLSAPGRSGERARPMSPPFGPALGPRGGVIGGS
jgi:hypothetical protein